LQREEIAMHIPMVGEVEAILFDFEGTLVDFQWNLAGAVAETLEMLRGMGFPKDGIRSRKYSTLMPEAMQVASEIGLQPDEVREQIGRVYDRFDEDALTRWALRPNVTDFLNEVKRRGGHIALVSNIGNKILSPAMSKLGLEGYFGVTVNRNNVTNPKPDPQGINYVLEKLSVQKDKAVFVGDSLDDVNAARNAGLRVIIIGEGENLKEEILAAKPERIINGYAELLRDIN
jgi:phosphoglycolate phosphatase